MTGLAVIIVSWNVRDLLADCLRSVQADLSRSGLAGQIWVVDNASTDGTVEMLRRNFPNARVIASVQNLGFAGGNNAALRAIGFGEAGRTPNVPTNSLPEAALLLNPDTIVHPQALESLLNFLRHTPQAAVAGARLLYGDGSFQHSAFGFPGLGQLAIELLPLPGRLVESGWNGRYPRTLYYGDRPFEIEHPLGAAMCVRREAIEQVGLLDEGYHMYVEEIDWSKRMAGQGWKAYCVPGAVITHLGGQSTGQITASSFINLWTSRYRFYGKHYHPLKVWLAAQIVKLGMRRKAKAERQAAAQGQLPAAELAGRLKLYRQVVDIWQGAKG